MYWPQATKSGVSSSPDVKTLSEHGGSVILTTFVRFDMIYLINTLILQEKGLKRKEKEMGFHFMRENIANQYSPSELIDSAFREDNAIDMT